MKLVKFQQPIFETIQGEGVHVGAPSTFVRLYGCDYSCSWCDTKGSWDPTAKYEDMTVLDVAEKVHDLGHDHVVITGGNPLLQATEVHELVSTLYRFRGRYHVTVETQMSMLDDAGRHLLALVDLLSMSPKLHDWRWEPIHRAMNARDIKTSQMKVVVRDREEAIEAVSKMRELTVFAERHLLPFPYFYLQPETGSGRAAVSQAVDVALATRDIHVSVLPQIHKRALYVL